MRYFLLVTISCALGASPLASAAAIFGTISGTCGFYQGSPANVVYSQQFSGDGTFCTGFMSGGSFTINDTVEVDDISAFASNSLLAFAPTGYGVFANFDVNFQVTQNYLFQPSVTPSTPTGTVMTNIFSSGGTDDGSGLGSCTTTTGINILGNTSGSFSFPVTFGQPVPVVETAHITCNQYGPVPGSSGWGDEGMRSSSAGPVFAVYDSNGKFVSNATLVNVTPEPPSVLLVFSAIGWIARTPKFLTKAR